MKKVSVLFVLIIASLALVACGSSSSSSTESSAESGAATEAETESGTEAEAGAEAGSGLQIEAAASGLAYASDTAEWKAGKFTVEFTNPQAIPHDVAIEDSSGKMVGEAELVAEGSSSTEVDLKPGTYTYFCTVPGHREAGMEGTLTVK
jgi:plastocyanin